MSKITPQQGGRPKYVKYMWWTFGGLWAVVFLFFFFLSIGWIGDMPQFEEIENPHSLQASEIISDDGEVLGYIGFENRSNVTYDQLSHNLVDALIATEDARF